MMMDTWTDRLSEYLDGDLPTTERAALEAHLRECVNCQGTLQQLRAVVVTAQQMIDRSPATDLWPGIASRIAPTPIKAIGDVAPPLAVRRFAFSISQLAAASIALMLVSGGTIYLATHHADPQVAAGPAPRTTPSAAAITTDQAVNRPLVAVKSPAAESYDVAINELTTILKTDRAKLDTATVRVLETNLKTIDNAINEVRTALARDPGNLYLNRYLDESMQRKIQLLRRATGILRAQT